MKTPSKVLFLTVALSSTMLAGASAQTLSKYAPQGAMLAVELNDLGGVRKSAASFVKEFERLKLPSVLAEASGSSKAEQKATETQLNDFMTLLDREGFVAVYASAKSTVGYLLAARPASNAEKQIKAMQAAAVKSGVQGSLKIQGFPVYRSSFLNFGYSGGLAYAASDTAILTQFLSSVKGVSKEKTLGNSSSFSEVMNEVGGGNVRLYADLRNLTQIGRAIIDGIDPELPGVKLEPILDAITTIGRFAGAWKISSEGIDSTQYLVPEKRGVDKQFAQLMTPKTNASLKAASVVPASAIGFTVQQLDVTGWYNWLSTLVDRTGLNDGGLQPFFKQEFGLDVQKDFLSWMTGEYATANFNLKASSAGSSNPLAGLGDGVTYLGVSDESAAKNAISRILPKLIETGLNLANQNKGNLSPTKTTMSGVEITRYPISQGVALVTAIKNGYLMVSNSDAAMLAALSSGARLNDSATFKAAIARVPQNALSYGYGDTTASLNSTADTIGMLLDLGLSQGFDLKPSTAKTLSSGLKGMLNFTANRAGSAVTWTEGVANGTKTKSFQPVKW
jgi:Protein of unknown function (DUF3352)